MVNDSACESRDRMVALGAVALIQLLAEGNQLPEIEAIRNESPEVCDSGFVDVDEGGGAKLRWHGCLLRVCGRRRGPFPDALAKERARRVKRNAGGRFIR
jgi:hypothetical protein